MPLPKAFTIVTPYSKYLAMALFIIFPFIAFCLGIQYEKMVTPSYPPTQYIPPPPKLLSNSQSMAGKFIWNVPANTLSVDAKRELQSAFSALKEIQQNDSTHLSVDAINTSSESSNFAVARLTVRNHENQILPTDGIEYYLHRTNDQWDIITGSEANFCQKVKVFPEDLIDATSYYSYYGCIK
jgi:hypothetical protein